MEWAVIRMKTQFHHIFGGDSENELTVFLDIILTKYFRERGVNGC